MPVRFRCSGCRTRLSIGHHKAGSSIRCPKCNAEQTVPAPISRNQQPKNPSNPAANELPARYLIAGVGLIVLLCVGSYVAGSSFGNRNPRGEEEIADSKHDEKPGTPIAFNEAGDSQLFPLLDFRPPPVLNEKPKPPPPDAPPKKPLIDAPAADPPATPRNPPLKKKLIVKRRQNADAETLRKQLFGDPELHIDRVPRTSEVLVALATGPEAPESPSHDATVVMANRADLRGLPMRMGQDCRLGKEPAENLQVLSRKLRRLLAMSIPKNGIDTRPDPEVLRGLLLDGRQTDPANPAGVEGRNRPQEWLSPGAVPALMQLLQAESMVVRTVLVEVLGKIKGKPASEALTNRAIMDLSPEVRELAVAELKSRPAEEYVPALLQGLRYPWLAAADHAAEALAALKTEEAIVPLLKMLGENDPALPVTLGEGPAAYQAVREVVRINHLGNCVLCHPLSAGRGDMVRGSVPSLGQALPPPSAAPLYYEREDDRRGTFVRADITYLRQDFSVVQPVPNHGLWPEHQRFDYMVRYRPVNATEIAQIQNKLKERQPHKESMLFALRVLTGKDLDKTAGDWPHYLPPDPSNKKRETDPEQK